MKGLFKHPVYLIVLVFLYSICCSSCGQVDVFEKNTPFIKHEWRSIDTAKAIFNISDTTAVYNVYIVLRHTDAYKYNNIWLLVGIQEPGDSTHYQKVNLSLGDDANGWEGSGMNDIWEVRKPFGYYKFNKKGDYHFSLTNIMRDDPLLHMMSAGLRVVKAK